MLHEMTITVDDADYETLRPFVERQTIGALLSQFARSRSGIPAYTQAELEAGYRAMAADEEYEQEAQEWINALTGGIDEDNARRSMVG